MESEITDFATWVMYNSFNPKLNHPGLDFVAYKTRNGKCQFGLSENTLIRAVQPGVVAKLTSNEGYFNFVTIDHPERRSPLSSTYVHVNPRVNRGQFVERGQVIGELFHQENHSRGKANVVHLHLGLIENDRYIDPYPLVSPDQNWEDWKAHSKTAIIPEGLNKRFIRNYRAFLAQKAYKDQF
jgi:murein DD-endopeptidase MepM/ murein hydrolase activator NlpD